MTGVMTAHAYFESLQKEILARVSGVEGQLLAEFADLFWSRAPEDDLQGRDVEDDIGLFIDSGRLFKSRQSDEVDIHISNPVRSRDGWQSRHTIVRVMAPNMPFAADSVLLALSQGTIVTHLMNNVVFSVERDDLGSITSLSLDRERPNRELFIYAEIDRLAHEDLPLLKLSLEQTMADLRAVVDDFQPMKAKLADILNQVQPDKLPISEEEYSEGVEFLRWLSQDNFTFLGYREFRYANDEIHQEGETLGMLKLRSPASVRKISEQSDTTQQFLLEPKLLAFSKSGTKSRVHRPAYPDYVGIKQFNEAGQVIGEWGFLGLYTSSAYMKHPRDIPVLRHKIQRVQDKADYDPAGFDGKVLAQILATYPRDELFQIEESELLETAVAITNFHERRKLRLFVREDRYGLFVNCLLYMPRDLYNTRSRLQIEQLLVAAFEAEGSEYDIFLSESILIRLQFILRVKPGRPNHINRQEVEDKIAQTINDWNADLGQALLGAFGETRGRKLIAEYANAFSAGYREHHSAKVAADDVECLEALSTERPLITRLYRHPEDDRHLIRLKVFHLGEALPLSDQIPKMENLGLRVLGEDTSQVRRSSKPWISIHDFRLTYEQELVLEDSSLLFEEAFINIWEGIAEDDAFNRLILGAGLSWRQVSVLRAYSRYLKQIRLGFSQEFIANTLYKHRQISAVLLKLFEQRFAVGQLKSTEDLEDGFYKSLDDVDVLNEDRILRRIFDAIKATLRTNYNQRDPNQRPKPYFAFKLNPSEIPGVPRPLPMYEIFVWSPYFEGVHLRGGPIARGGLRWSDRLEDYRTEVLGLMKAQIVKNGVIVPTGAKGGFVLKHAVGEAPRDVLDCYREFISGLLDVTDNIVDGQVVPPEDVRRYDRDDPYLVVAADKGTASFSDYANQVAEGRGFWMGDAFASGGSNGYDHKKMGITAKGAWVSVQRHFAEKGIDVQTEPVTVLGIGDMSGDVFGNGMLLSRSIKLVAAFNHMHVFLDPSPDSETSYLERNRLFELPRSTWDDYDKSLISDGGGIYSRQLKSISLTPEVRAALQLDASALSPDELIHELLKSPVDLIWNGGIGTYVKSTLESHDDVGDKANDQIRVNALEVKAQVVGEGGNLGLTQLARVEYSRHGGAVNTDFIDNSAGVDCSDHEVNLKILLNQVVTAGDITVKQRNEKLEEMTEAVSELVLTNNRNQARSLSLASRHQDNRLGDYRRFINRMEEEGGLDRALEFLPSDEELNELESREEGFTRPELAVLLSYAKIHLKNSLRAAGIHKDDMVVKEALHAFPAALAKNYRSQILNHQLAPEIVASQVANTIVDYMGITFIAHNMEFVGARVALIAKAYLAFAETFGLRPWCDQVQAISTISEPTKLEMLLEIMRLGRAGTRWVLRHRRDIPDLNTFVEHNQPLVMMLVEDRGNFMSEHQFGDWQHQVDALISEGVPELLAKRTARATRMAEVFPIIDAAETLGVDVLKAGEVFVGLSQSLRMDLLSSELAALPTNSHWESMERNAMLDDNNTQLALLTQDVFEKTQGDLDQWMQKGEEFMADWNDVMDEAIQSKSMDLSMYSLTSRKLSDLRRAVQLR